MKKLENLLEKLKFDVICGNTHIDTENLRMDSRKVSKGDVFVCIHGANFDGHKFITDVIKKGAIGIVVEQKVDLENICAALKEDGYFADKNIADDSIRNIEKSKYPFTIVKVDNTKYALACMSAAYFDYPAEKLKTIGITGTKGKTTTSYMVYEVLQKAGIKTGLIGTIETIIGDEHIPSVNTTPESYEVQKTFAKMVEKNIEAVVMEVSSQGLMLHRVSGFTFDYGIFTNLGKDHIGENEHKDFEDYMHCKSLLFKQCKHGIINVDDDHAKDMIKDAVCHIETFGMNEKADLRAGDISLYTEPGVLGIAYDLTVKGDKTYPLRIDIPGKFNVYNSLTAIAVCRHFTHDMSLIENVLSDIRVRGRAEIVPVSEDFTVMIDYAHNAMSLESLLASLKEYNPKRIVTVFGCGGNRDRNRRFEMGEVSSKMADFTVVTSDNPRHEKPEDILADIVTGVKKADGDYIAIIDRQEAVTYAITHALKGDVIVIAGKGHEDYQIIGDTKYHMDDRELVENAKKDLMLKA